MDTRLKPDCTLPRQPPTHLVTPTTLSPPDQPNNHSPPDPPNNPSRPGQRVAIVPQCLEVRFDMTSVRT